MKSPAMIAQQFRLKEWAEQIKNCNNRPIGMTVDGWCKKNGITKANYYYRLKRIRQVYLETVPEKETQTAIVPLEIMNSSAADIVTSKEAKALIPSDSLEITGNGFTLTVTSNTPLELLSKVLKVVSDA